MKRIYKSFGHSLQGITHAFGSERNLQLFTPAFLAVLIGGLFVGLLTWEWLALIMMGTVFLSVELLNTALERLTDILDDQRKVMGGARYHSMLKAAKDVAAGASLISLIGVIIVICIIFFPYAKLYVG